MRTDGAPSAAHAAAHQRLRVISSPVGSRRVEGSLAVAMSLFGLLFSVQSLPSLVSQWPSLAWSWIGPVLVVAMYGAILLAGTAAVLRTWTRSVFLGAATMYLVSLALWLPAVPVLETAVEGRGSTPAPWLYLLGTVSCGFFVVALRSWALPAAYAVVTCLVFGIGRTTPSGGSATVQRASLEALYALVLDLVLLVLVVAVRQAAASVDRAQSNALQRYSEAQIDSAIESERVQIDALVHDRVLTTFLSTAKAESDADRRLAASMAATAISELASAQRAAVGAGAGDAVAVGDLAARIMADAGAVADLFQVQTQGDRQHTVPASAAEALVSAAVQAMVNSANHAGGPRVPRSLRVLVTDARAVAVTVADRGRGFDLAAIGTERLGVRISIGERMRTAGGEAAVRSAPGQGTRVTVTWPSEPAPAPAEPGIVPVFEPAGIA